MRFSASFQKFRVVICLFLFFSFPPFVHYIPGIHLDYMDSFGEHWPISPLINFILGPIVALAGSPIVFLSVLPSLLAVCLSCLVIRCVLYRTLGIYARVYHARI